MTRTVHGKVHGKNIELAEDLGIPDGSEVDVIVTPSKSTPSWGDGIKHSAGAAANVTGFDEVFDQVKQDRVEAQFREPPQ